MDLYWEQLVQNILGGSSPPPTKTTPSVSDERKTESREVKEVNDSNKKLREKKILREKKNEVKKRPKKSRSRKKHNVEEDDDTTVLVKGLKNLSLTSDEGIDITFTPILSTSLASIPRVIMRPQHHLCTSWTFWYSVGDKNLSWEQNQKKICTVSTIEQFWYVISQLKPPSSIQAGHTYSVFRAGVLPDWEDEDNVEGGRWMISCLKVERENKLDTMWQEILFMLVGEHLEEFSGLVNGAEACARKKGDRLEVWVKEVSLMKGVVDVGRRVKEKLGLESNRKMKFSLHKEDKEGVKGPRLAL